MSCRKTKKMGVYRPDSPYSQAECESIIQKLELFLDGQLHGKARAEVERLIADCEYCAEQYKLEKRLRQLLARRWHNLHQEAQEIAQSVWQRLRKSFSG
ncbi:MAG: hypothetical protein RMJ49_06955 [Bacteroidia bacterium]|nr:hypothetical protein [Bacteroidia bacterium]